jgi:hypothetical protein
MGRPKSEGGGCTVATSETESARRLEPARQRARNAKRALVAAAAMGFVVTVLLARAWNPGTATTSSGSQPTPGSGGVGSASDVSQSDDDLFGSATIAPSSSSGSFNVGTRSS